MSEEVPCIKLSLKEELAVIQQRLTNIKNRLKEFKHDTHRSEVYLDIAEDMVRLGICWIPKEIE